MHAGNEAARGSLKARCSIVFLELGGCFVEVMAPLGDCLDY